MVDLRQYDLPALRLVRELVRKWWRLELAFADETGYVLDHGDGKIVPSGNEFCRQALFSKEGFRRCNESVKLVRDRLASGRRRTVVVHSCHLGFDVVAAPIQLDGVLAGFLFTGGAWHAEPTAAAKQELVGKVRELAAAPAAELEAALPAVPRMGAAELEHLCDLVEQGARAVMEAHAERARAAAPAAVAAAPSAPPHRFRELVGAAPAMREVFGLLEKIVKSEATVLIHGESGTGKELIARAIHYNGPRAKGPFVVQNCSAFNDNLLESALFGHMRGSFTGAVKDTKGLFEVADGGTFFLDEIGDMSPALQVKLLRVLQEGVLSPVGATKPVKVDVRIIAASHKDLGKMVERGEFREDLYYRINVIRLTMPPLRDRIDDLPMLVDHFLAKHGRGAATTPRLGSDAMALFARYRWPGNIRELENEIERLLVLGGDQAELGAGLVSPRILAAAEEAAAPRAGTSAAATAAGPGAPVAAALAAAAKPGASLREVVEGVEAELIAQGLIRTHWNKSQLAKELGISRSNLIQKCAYYGLDRKD